MELNSNLEFSFSVDSQSVAFEPRELSARSMAIHENAIQRAKKYLVAEAELLEAIIEVDKDRTYEQFGEAYLTPYCIKYLGLSDDVAGYFVRVARKSRQIPELKKAVVDGEISVTKARTIASVLTRDNQHEWIEKAKTLSREKLERQVASAAPAGKKPERAKPSGPQTTRLELELPNSLMDLFRRAQDIVSQSQGKSASLVETQEQLLRFFLRHKDPVQKAERADARKQKKQGAKSSQASDQRCIAADPSRDGSKKSNATDMNAGDKNARDNIAGDKTSARSSIPSAVKHAVYLRDQGKCQARLSNNSICGETRWLQLHHKIPKSHGGLDTAKNLITICSGHHRLWHKRRRSR